MKRRNGFKKLSLNLLVIVYLIVQVGLAISCSTSVGRVTGMHTLYPVGTSLAIEITPNKSAQAGKYYTIVVSYLKIGRARTAISWTELEISLAKPKNVYIPLSQEEARTLYMEDESKLRQVFGVTINPEPIDVATIKEWQKQGIITIYQ